MLNIEWAAKPYLPRLQPKIFCLPPTHTSPRFSDAPRGWCTRFTSPHAVSNRARGRGACAGGPTHPREHDTRRQLEVLHLTGVQVTARHDVELVPRPRRGNAQARCDAPLAARRREHPLEACQYRCAGKVALQSAITAIRAAEGRCNGAPAPLDVQLGAPGRSHDLDAEGPSRVARVLVQRARGVSELRLHTRRQRSGSAGRPSRCDGSASSPPAHGAPGRGERFLTMRGSRGRGAGGSGDRGVVGRGHQIRRGVDGLLAVEVADTVVRRRQDRSGHGP
jgi:hypothetical protein